MWLMNLMPAGGLFIAYIVGLSIGIHLLNLLAIGNCVCLVFQKISRYQERSDRELPGFSDHTRVDHVWDYPRVVTIASWFELMFVNGMGLPFNTGVILYAVLLIGLIVFGIHYTMKKKLVFWNTVLVSLTVILIGYSSFAMIVIGHLPIPLWIKTVRTMSFLCWVT
jgi:uncharacterized membrane-anchored protein